MTEEERNSLLKKVAKKIIPQKTGISSKINFHPRGKTSIKYNTSKINETINKYKFPTNFNFIDEEKATIHIKHQNKCGCCWAFSTTTALSYRFHKLGIEVDLSPQYLLSCYINQCDKGDQLIDTQLYLVRNGTTTEGCMPYSSGNGIITEKCSNECKNGEEFTKYYSKNAYSIDEEYNEENFYDIIALIMDQLITYGPVSSGIVVYQDFDKLNEKKYSDIIYRYDNISEYIGGHAVVIVGYGLEKEKFYWIIQNSWGETFGVNGFAKIEFGQIEVEKISFSEPYIENNSTEKEINVTLQFNENCKFKFNIEENDTEEDYFEMTFMSVDSPKDSFYYQCGSPKISDKNEGICAYQYESLLIQKGYYKFKDYQSLKKKNTFNLDFSGSQQHNFYFYGIDYIESVSGKDLYISEEGSKIFLRFYSLSEDTRFISNIYPNINSTKGLSACYDIHLYELGFNYSFIYCDIKQFELDFFKSSSNNQPLAYDILCGEKEEMLAKVHILDKTKYPVFKINRMTFPNTNYLNSKSEIVLTANIEGSISQFQNGNIFGIYSIIKTKDAYYLVLIFCKISMPPKVENNFKIYCNLDINPKITLYDPSEFIYKYTFPLITSCPYEVIFEDETILDIEEDENDIKKITTYSKFIQIHFLLGISLLLLLLFH